MTGPTFHYSDTWQLIINTGTTIVTFLMVFLIQNTQNRDAKAVHLKLDEIIRALKGARNELVDLEELSDEDLKKLEKNFMRIRQKASTTDITPPRNESHPNLRSRARLPAPACLGALLCRFAEKFCRSGKAEKLRSSRNPACARNSGASVPDEPVAPVRPVFAWDDLHQIALDLFRIGLTRQSQPLR